MGQNPFAFAAANAAGQIRPGFVDSQSALGAADLHAVAYLQSFAGRLYKGTSQVPAVLSAGLATTYTGLCLSNPAASKVNLIIQKVSAVILVAPAAVLALGLIVPTTFAGITAHTTPLTPISAKTGQAAPVAANGLLDAACTLVGAPQWYDWLWVNSASAALLASYTNQVGGLIIGPGSYVAIGANVAGPAAGFVGSFEWEECPLV
jgi:hypothetical protein